ncbi:GIY-YIG nuclease family protein [Paenibacillus sp. SAF-054]|uniref:GIY-YIG nuclease family protein n=1 Tax=Paenibacillus sp. SAFN-054 TaxID=3436865 RepID=UPI003F80F253
MTDLQTTVRQLPLTPGVYLMKDAQGGIIYVGKSKCLRKRVQSYFYENASHAPKIKKLVRHVKEIEVRQTDTEFEALMLECSLIHAFKPMYNRKMKNPSSYSYIVIPTADGLRRTEITHLPLPAVDCVVFGPYTASRNTVEKAVQAIYDCFKIACNHTAGGALTPCLNYSLGLCLGMCLGGDGLNVYNRLMTRFIGMLDGSDESLLEDMQQQMMEAAENFDFEKAAKFRDAIRSADFLKHKEKVISFAEQNRNIVIYEQIDEVTIKVFWIKRSSVLFSRQFLSAGDPSMPLHTEVMELSRECFTRNEEAYTAEIGREEIDEAQIIYSYIAQHSGRVLTIPDEWLQEAHAGELSAAITQWLTDWQPRTR